MLVTVYSKPDCHLCEDVVRMLDRLAPQYNLDVRTTDITDDPALYEAFSVKIPVVVAGDGSMGRLVAPIGEKELRGYLDMVRSGGPRESLPVEEFWVDRAARYIGKHWLRLVSVALALFVGLPFLAAIFASLGWWGLADPIYMAYAIQCHQLPERAPTFFGFESAQCIRCSALYGGMLLFGVVYGVARDRKVSWLRWLLRPAPWYVLVLLLLPILFDGVSHMSGLRGEPRFDFDPGFGMFDVGAQAFSLNWWLRVVTGLTAGLGVVWFAYPRMERVVKESNEMRVAYQMAATRKGYAVTEVARG